METPLAMMDDIEEVHDTFDTAPSSPAYLDGQQDNTMEIPQPKLKGRQKLLRGLQRISSSPTLAQLGRSRSSSNPYSMPGSLSCVSLSSSPSPFGQPSATSYFSHASTAEYSSAPTSIPGSPITETPEYDGIESILAIRKVEDGAAAIHSPTVALPTEVRVKKSTFNIWAKMPHEISVHIFSFLQPRELVRASRVSKGFYKLSFDGQLWTCFDASEFYREIPAESLAKIIVAAGPFVKDLNLRGCVQVEHYRRAEVVVKACKNLMNATLEGCRNLQRTTLHSLLKSNEKLAYLNLKGLTAVTNATCKIIAQSCPQLEAFNVSWCKHMDARGITTVVQGCPKLRDLRAGEIRGFDGLEVAEALFRTNNLERLVLAGCEDLTDAALQMAVHGPEPEIDLLTDIPMVPSRRLRHLDLTRCTRLTNQGVRALAHLVPELEGLQLTGVNGLTDAALEPILASTPRLTHLELEDLAEITNSLLSEHLAKAPCAPVLEHLSVSYCENVSDVGMLPVFTNCTALRSVDMDNTRVSDFVLAEAAAMVRKRAIKEAAAAGAGSRQRKPRIGLSLVVYDCQHVTWTGVREVLSRNSEVRVPRSKALPPRPPTPRPEDLLQPSGEETTMLPPPPPPKPQQPAYPAEIISLKCFYGWQMTVDEHTKRVLRGDLTAAARLERKWADFMQANEEAGITGSGGRRRRRRAREAQMAHDDEEGGPGAVMLGGRRRARTAACAVM